MGFGFGELECESFVGFGSFIKLFALPLVVVEFGVNSRVEVAKMFISFLVAMVRFSSFFLSF